MRDLQGKGLLRENLNGSEEDKQIEYGPLQDIVEGVLL